MKYLQTFESYLKGGRQPLYHWTKNLKSVIEEDELKVSSPSRDKHLRGRTDPNQLKSISVTRDASFEWLGRWRFVLDHDQLIRDGYKVEPFDEIGFAITRMYKKVSKSLYHRGYKKVYHGLNNITTDKDAPNIGIEEEHEERIYSNIKNLGKYIIYIETRRESNLNEEIEEILSSYIKKYPHIQVRKIQETKDRQGNKYMLSDRGEVLMNINTIKEKETIRQEADPNTDPF